MIKKIKQKKPLKGWRTVTFNGLASILPLVDIFGQVLNIQEIQNILPDNYLPYYLVLVSVVNLILRKYTTTPIGKKI